LDEQNYIKFTADPSRIKAIVRGNLNYKQFVIDEVQKVPKILDSIHELIEEFKGHQFILTGSSARKLRREGVNLLGARAIKTNFHPFMAAELGDNFELEFALKKKRCKWRG
jgi:predicted AAA+ superfamily ATPase